MNRTESVRIGNGRYWLAEDEYVEVAARDGRIELEAGWEDGGCSGRTCVTLTPEQSEVVERRLAVARISVREGPDA